MKVSIIEKDMILRGSFSFFFLSISFEKEKDNVQTLSTAYHTFKFPTPHLTLYVSLVYK